MTATDEAVQATKGFDWRGADVDAASETNQTINDQNFPMIAIIRLP